MQQELQIFQYENQAKIRTVTIAGDIWFYGVDVCQALEITNTGNAYARLDSDDIHTMDGVDATGRKSNIYIVSEYGLYDLILQSRKAEAKQFKRWVTHEVIPQIRKTGAFAVGKARPSLPVFVRRFNDNWHRVDMGYFSIISELFIRVYGRLEQMGHVLPDKGHGGKEIRPDVSVGKTFPKWLKKHHPLKEHLYKFYDHKLPNSVVIQARQYRNDVLPVFIEFIETEWIPNLAYPYFKSRDAIALDYLPKLLAAPPKK